MCWDHLIIGESASVPHARRPVAVPSEVANEPSRERMPPHLPEEASVLAAAAS